MLRVITQPADRKRRRGKMSQNKHDFYSETSHYENFNIILFGKMQTNKCVEHEKTYSNNWTTANIK
jgi:hypothetical protein